MYCNNTSHHTGSIYPPLHLRLGHVTSHFNVGNYRRIQKGKEEVQDASFFDSKNEAGLEARQKALVAALDAMLGWLESGVGQVAIFDATNSTAARRQFLVGSHIAPHVIVCYTHIPRSSLVIP